jgi:tripeptide aminopeptidase
MRFCLAPRFRLLLTISNPTSTSEDDPLFKAAHWATLAVNLEPTANTSSTDSNFPMSVGIPAITVSGGGVGGDSHSPSEWYEPKNAYIGLQRIFLLVLAYDELSAQSGPTAQ